MTDLVKREALKVPFIGCNSVFSPFFLKAASGWIIGQSEMYSSLAVMEKGIASVKANAPTAQVADLAT